MNPILNWNLFILIISNNFRPFLDIYLYFLNKFNLNDIILNLFGASIKVLLILEYFYEINLLFVLAFRIIAFFGDFFFFFF
jgi:hypothetical protein